MCLDRHCDHGFSDLLSVLFSACGRTGLGKNGQPKITFRKGYFFYGFAINLLQSLYIYGTLYATAKHFQTFCSLFSMPSGACFALHVSAQNKHLVGVRNFGPNDTIVVDACVEPNGDTIPCSWLEDAFVTGKLSRHL
jgi:hypothetical protein